MPSGPFRIASYGCVVEEFKHLDPPARGLDAAIAGQACPLVGRRPWFTGTAFMGITSDMSIEGVLFTRSHRGDARIVEDLDPA
jgi:hypothetical protein